MRFCGLFILIQLFAVMGYAQSSNPVGNAFAQGDDCYVVTNDQLWQLGAVWFNDPLNLNDPFEITLTMNFGSNDVGADGMVFVLQQVGTSALGIPGGGIGFEGFFPSLGIELDTHENIDLGDPFSDHMAIVRDGQVNHNFPSNLAGPIPMNPFGANVEDGQDHVFQVIWDPTAELLEIYFDCELRLSLEIDIIQEIFDGDNEVTWGFTGATGGLSNLQSVCISEYALGLEPEYEICTGESVELGVFGAPGGTFDWSPMDFLSDPTSSSPTATPESDIEYSVTFTDICGDVTTLTTSIEVNDAFVEVPEILEACEGFPVLVEADGFGDVFTWNDGSEGSSLLVEEPGGYEVTATSGSCTATASGTFSWLPIPTPDAWVDEFIFCEGEAVELSAFGQDIATYDWSTNEDSPIIIVNETSSVEVEITGANGCSDTYSAEVVVNPIPDPQLPALVEACDGEFILITPAVTGDSYEWTSGETTASITPTESGVYTLSITDEGCTGSGTVEVLFSPTPQFEFPSEASLCQGDNAWIQLPNLPYEWYWQGSVVTDSVEISGSGFYEITALDVDLDCSTSKFLDVDILFAPQILLPEQGLLCEGSESLTVQAEVFDADSVAWSTGENTFSIEITEAGEYILSAQNACGQSQQTFEVISGRCECPMFVPNAFTPNLDGRNELFTPVIECPVDKYTFSIYNRWGEILFTTTEQGAGWNGAAPGKSHFVQDDVYVWQVTFEVILQDGISVVNEMGHVVIFR